MSLRSGANNIKQFVELNNEFGLNTEAVQFKGEAPMWTDLGGDVVDLGTGSYGAASQIIQAGKGRPIAVSRKRIGLMPDVATFRLNLTPI